MGTPEFAVPSLSLLAQHHAVVDVMTQPDRPAGRGRILQAPPVKKKALELDLPVHQPRGVRDADVIDRIQQLKPTIIAVVGYGQILPESILSLPELGCINLHSSLLPKYRGAAPLNWALVHGDDHTGLTTMNIAKKLDAGDILLTHETQIHEDETASELTKRLAPVGAALLCETIKQLESGNLQPIPQKHEAATYAPLIRREDGCVNWSLSARDIYNRLRGFDPWPGIYSFFRGKRLRIWAARPDSHTQIEPGQLAWDGTQLRVGCGKECLILIAVQLQGENRLSAADFVHGYHLSSGEKLFHE